VNMSRLLERERSYWDRPGSFSEDLDRSVDIRHGEQIHVNEESLTI